MNENKLVSWEGASKPNYYFKTQVIMGKNKNFIYVFLLKNMPIDNQIKVWGGRGGGCLQKHSRQYMKQNNKIGLSLFCHT